MTEYTGQRKTLWMLIYDDETGRHFEAFYAFTEEEAREQAQQWMEQQPRHCSFVEMRAYPHGFVVQFGHGLPGSR